ncbi:transcriptional regulator [Vibrio albus]|uniref:Transcriptional regulator n=1 Tax=Vibrio albus TaxID=2200953 RepID=A0A2U3B9K9_9VIBR|nr:LuxR family transcriptional regulator [Vibrio albus]PWI33457.1 transcriptional regulator [Vibrio albus]
MDPIRITKLYELITDTDTCTSLKDLNNIINNSLDIIGYEYYLVGISTPISITKSHSGIIDNYPYEWRKTYDNNDLKEIDPIFLYSTKNSKPILWEDPNIKNITHNMNSDINVMEEAKKYHLSNGVTIPIHATGGTFGMCSFANRDNTLGYFDMAIIASQTLSPVIISCFHNDPSFKNTVPEPPALTNREVECLKWSAEGKTAWEIAKISNCSERTVVFHLTNVCEKLNASNKYQAISKAIITGIIN